MFALHFCSLFGSETNGWSIEYGQKSNQVSYLNAESDKNFAEDSAYGPLSFRVVKNKMWLLDSIGGKLLIFGSDKKLRNYIKIPDIPKNVILEDFAIVRGSDEVPQAVWVAEASSRTIRKISLATGKEMLRIGEKKGYDFLQIHQIEVDKEGRLYVGDYGKSKIAIFTPYGKLIREIPWQLSDFSVDEVGHLYNLYYSGTAGYILRVYLANGVLARSIHIGLPDLKNGKIVAVTPSGGIYAMFVPVNGFEKKLKLIEISRFGAIGRVTEVIPTMPMNRFVSCDHGQIWNAIADFYQAPKGWVEIKAVDWN